MAGPTQAQLEARFRLEAQLRSAPDDDPSWAVYADVLAEIGDARGELINLERQLAADPSEALAARVAALREANLERWRPFGLPDSAELTWRYGFVRGLTLSEISTASELDDLRESLRREPFLVELGLRFARRGRFRSPARDLVRSTLADLELGRLASLQIAYHCQAEGVVDALVGLSGLELETLDLRYAELSDLDLRRLFFGEALAGLRSLSLQHNPISAVGVEALARSRALLELERLDLRGNHIGVEGAELIANSPVLTKLEVLHVHNEDIDDEAGLEVLARSERLSSMLTRHFRGREVLA